MILRICILSAILFFVASAAYASPIAVAGNENVTVTLYDEPCAMKDWVDMPMRATLEKDGWIYEGCYQYAEWLGLVEAYFEDLSVVPIPATAFRVLRSM